MYFTNDPVADAERCEVEKERTIQKCPVCCICGEHITDDTCYVISDEVYCECCMDREFKKYVEDLID